MTDFIYENFSNSNLIKLRDQYKLRDVIKSGKTEFEKMLTLMNWVHKNINKGTPKKFTDKFNAFNVLDGSKRGKKYYCTHFSITFLQCAQALGWFCRRVAIDRDHEFGEEYSHHGIVEIWSNQFNKWIAFDPMNNLYFEKKTAPLSAYEIRSEFLKDGAINVFRVVGFRKISCKPGKKGVDQPSNYFWFLIAQRNNFFQKPGVFRHKSYFLLDKYNKNKVWYIYGGKKGRSIKHPMYKTAIKVKEIKEIYYPPN